MAIFGNNKKTSTKKKTAPKKATAAKVTASTKTVPSDVLVRPHVTEKAAQATAKHVYTFVVKRDATKGQVAAAVEAMYKVTPVKVNIVKTPGARVSLRTRRGFGKRSDMKKAYVYLKEGDRIEFAS